MYLSFSRWQGRRRMETLIPRRTTTRLKHNINLQKIYHEKQRAEDGFYSTRFTKEILKGRGEKFLNLKCRRRQIFEAPRGNDQRYCRTISDHEASLFQGCVVVTWLGSSVKRPPSFNRSTRDFHHNNNINSQN